MSFLPFDRQLLTHGQIKSVLALFIHLKAGINEAELQFKRGKLPTQEQLVKKLEEVRDGIVKYSLKLPDDAFTAKVEDVSQVVKLIHDTIDQAIIKTQQIEQKEKPENVLKDDQFYQDKIRQLENDIASLSAQKLNLKMKSLKDQLDFAINNAAKYQAESNALKNSNQIAADKLAEMQGKVQEQSQLIKQLQQGKIPAILQTPIQYQVDPKVIQRFEQEKIKLLADKNEFERMKAEHRIKQESQPNISFQQPVMSMDMLLSDEYERMPTYFQKAISKTHPMLRQLMRFHYEVIEKGSRISKGATEYQFERVIKNEMPQNPLLKNTRKYRLKCKICHLQFYQLEHEVEHVKTVHNGMTIGVTNDPYKKLMVDNICILGCGFQANSKSDLRNHLILLHSDLELTKWGMSRNFLKLQQQMISLQEFKDIINKNLNQGQVDPFDNLGNLQGPQGPSNLTAPSRKCYNLITLF